ncbi:hypothetical protein N7532_009556 [Penicillium argentinense]|uniref:Uncharacterized protein n=1 Tax=Penicillium argentinense TaxID=1131581 RepID=A0A9W9K3K8_9EURO|nr:uncharacterized protein N7532_009556 [Penicillium argentinense]KAJ5090872.1 hypothetical protein N7532_009556 [Penicillium argentinense]
MEKNRSAAFKAQIGFIPAIAYHEPRMMNDTNTDIEKADLARVAILKPWICLPKVIAVLTPETDGKPCATVFA